MVELQPGAICCISDLHLGDKGPTDNFEDKHHEPELINFLKFIQKEYREKKVELFVLGDLFEFWQANVGLVIVNRQNIIKALEDVGAKYIVGNHDRDILPLAGSNWFNSSFFQGMQETITRKINGLNFVFEHGHRHDPFNKDEWPGTGRILTILAGLVEREHKSSEINGVQIESDLEKQFQALGKAFKLSAENAAKESKWWEWIVSAAALFVISRRFFLSQKQLIETITGLQKYSQYFSKILTKSTPSQNADHKTMVVMEYAKNRAPNVDRLIIGHTHEAGKLQGQDWYYNSGSWVFDQREVLVIQPDGSIINCHWANDMLRPFEHAINGSLG